MPAYRDFEIRVVPSAEGLFRVSAECGGASRYVDRVAFPVVEDDALNGISDTIGGGPDSTRDMARRPGKTAPDIDDLGADLFNVLFSGGVRELYLESLSDVRARQEVLRICLHIDLDDPALARLASLPWEFMQHRERNEPLVLSSATTLIRRLPTASRVEPQRFVPPLRVLFVMADARGNLDLNAERSKIEEALTQAGNPIEVVFRDRVTWLAFDEELHRNDYHAVHFMGHGGFDGRVGVLEFQDRAVPGREVGVRLLKEPATRLAVLNACRTAEFPRVDGGDAFASVAASIALAGVPAVIAMQFPVTDAGAIAFATRLYTGIASQRSVEQAVDEARAGMRAVNVKEWGTPVLFLRATGELFSVEPETVVTADAVHSELAGIRDLLAREKGVPQQVLQAILEKMGEADVPAEQLAQRLEARAADYVRLRDALTAQSASRPDVAAVRAEALRLLEEGEIDSARRQLQENRTRIAEARQQSAREEAELLADEALIDRLEIRYHAAATKLREAADIVAFDRDERLEHLVDSADVLYLLGDEFGEDDALEEAVRLYQTIVNELDRERDPDAWARVHNNLGITLAGLSDRQGDPELLAEAVAAYQAALTVSTRDRDPLEWALTQNNVANTLARLGQLEGDADRLEEAVRVYREALRECTRERSPLKWAMTQNNLGNALVSLAELQDDPARLDQAVRVYRAALEVRTRDEDPMGWAQTQNNLGGALALLGEHEDDSARLEEAVQAFRATLEERTPERVPLQWAETQKNLGEVLASLGHREEGTARLKEAVLAYREALTEYTHERSPVDRALLQANLAGVLHEIATRTSGRREIEDAIRVLHEAIPEIRDAEIDTALAEEWLAALEKLRSERS